MTAQVGMICPKEIVQLQNMCEMLHVVPNWLLTVLRLLFKYYNENGFPVPPIAPPRFKKNFLHTLQNGSLMQSFHIYHFLSYDLLTPTCHHR